MRTRSGGPLVIGLVVLVLGGCGSSGGDPLTKAGFLARGNETCARTQKVIDDAADAAFPDKGQVPKAEATERFVNDTVIPEVRKEIEALDDLEPPKDDRARVDAILDAGRTGLGKLSENFSLIANKDKNPLVEYGDLAQAYGLKACGRNSEKTIRQLGGLS